MLLPIDDDAVFVSPRTVEQTLAEFDNPRVGAVAIPFINVRRDNIIRQQAPDSGRIYVTDAYVGAAHAIRRDRFLAAGGYRPRLFYMGEEGDLCIRMLNRGWVVRLGRADPMHHHESPLRVNRRADIYGRRNDVLFAWHNVPLPYFPLHLIATTFNGLRMGRRVGRLGTMAQGLALGFASIAREIAERRPVSRRTYRLSRMLKKRGVVPLEEIEPLLGPIAESS
jgi:GT2 family glycosyltransferase